MHRRPSFVLVATGSTALLLALTGCGATSMPVHNTGGSATVLMGSPPDTLDPSATVGTEEGVEADSQVYIDLLTFRQANGAAGGQIIAGLAERLPTVSDAGKTYTFTLRPGLVYSNGAPVHASDFAYSVERAIKLHNGYASATLTANIAGALAYAAGKASTISGIQTDNRTRQIRIHLSHPYGPFEEALAQPYFGPLPPNTPLKPLPNDPPLGTGPYKFASVRSGQGFSLVKNPRFASFGIPGISTGHLSTINVKYESNTSAEAESVLDNQADNFDAIDTVPPSLIQKLDASHRFTKVEQIATDFFFLNSQVPPFNNKLARQAVNYALDRSVMARLDSGFLTPSCYYLPILVVGHPKTACPYETATGGPNLAKPRRLLKEAGLVGAPVTVWGQQREPRRAWADYYASVLQSIGFKVTTKILSDATYFSAVGTVSNHAQTGFNDFLGNTEPADYYELCCDGKAITPTNNNNLSMINDPHIQRELATLAPLPPTDLTPAVTARWEALERYTNTQAYIVPFGDADAVEFFSTRLDTASAIFNADGNDWASWTLAR